MKVLLPLHNYAMLDVFKRRTHLNTLKLGTARKALERVLPIMKNTWISEQCRMLNATNGNGTKSAWDIVSKLRTDLLKIRTSAARQMKNQDGSTCKTPAENNEMFFVCKDEHQHLVQQLLMHCSSVQLFPNATIIQGTMK